MTRNILIIGCNGFIGSHLTQRILDQTDWMIHALDIADHNLQDHLQNPRLNFNKADIRNSEGWLDHHIQKADVVLPLAAIANPLIYVQNPIKVFELDFEANLAVVKQCLAHKTRLIFPSTSEVYGMAPDAEFDEAKTPLVLGPIHKERWIYSCSKQLLDRIIYAYGQHHGLSYTLFRPFNWIGPRLDNVFEKNANQSRVVSKFLSQIVRGENIELVDGGEQRRCFTDIDDGIDALMKIIDNEKGCAEQEIFNIGNPNNDFSIAELAETLLEQAKNYPKFQKEAAQVKIITVSAAEHYGKGYQDVKARVPAIHNAKEKLAWTPQVDMQTALRKTLDYYLG